LKPAVARDDMAFGISENGIRKAERLDRFPYLIDLTLGMRAGIARIGNEVSYRAVGDDQPRRDCNGSCFVHETKLTRSDYHPASA